MANTAKKLVENETLTNMSVMKNEAETQVEAPGAVVSPEQPKAPALSLEERIQRVAS